MYSYEDRIRAVRLYIKLGKRIGPTCWWRIRSLSSHRDLKQPATMVAPAVTA